MTVQDILQAFREGALTSRQTVEQLRRLESSRRLSDADNGAKATPRPPERTSPLTEGQRGLWMLQSVQPESSAYNIPLCFRLGGPVDVAALERACELLAVQHPILTSVLEETNGVPFLRSVAGAPSIEIADIAALDAEAVRPHLERAAKQPFVLRGSPLMRIHLFARSAEEHYLLIVLHHIICDGRSVELLVGTLFDAYECFLAGREPRRIAPAASFSDFATWEQSFLASAAADAHRAYWSAQLAGTLPTLNLPADARRASHKGIEGRNHSAAVPPELGSRIKAFCAEQGVTAPALFLSAYKVLLHRISGETDIIVGMPTIGRPEERFESLVGNFVNPVPLRDAVDGTQSAGSFLRAVQLTLIDALDHAAYPFPRIVRDLQRSGADTHAPVFQVVFEYKNGNVLSYASLERFRTSLSLEPVDAIRQEGEYELVLEVIESSGRFTLNVMYDANVFTPQTIARLTGHLTRLVDGIVSDPECALARLPLLSEEERRALLAEGNDPAVRFPSGRCLHDLFAEQAARTPDALAVIFGGEVLTYGELDHRANQLAHHLRALGVGPETIVGLCVERSLDIVVGILGILKAGGAYLPLDPAYPSDRLAFMLAAARASVVIAQSAAAARLPRGEVRVICIESDAQAIGTQPTTAPDTGVTPESLAYVIYTSGSTGTPNGVMITHANVVRLFTGTEALFHFGADDVWTLFHSYAFDFSVWEIWGALLYGGRVVVVPHLVSRTPELFYDLLHRERVTVLNQTPSAFNQLVRVDGEAPKPLDLRWVIFGGEGLKVEQLRPWLERHGDRQPQLINMYGITETTVHVTHRPIRMQDLDGPISSPIGGPLPDLQCYVLDERMEPMPVGVPGELYVGGAGLARGYLNNPELTMQRFLANPFREGGRLYRTGDLVRYLGGGAYEFLGRVDFQVKIRGHRIELGEIEAALLRHEDVKDAVVLARDEASGQKRLVAYVAGGEARALREHLRKTLPEYMVPAAFVRLDAMPLNHNGKADRKALAAMPVGAAEAKRTARLSRGDIEERVLAAWKDTLGVPDIDVEDGFFDAGGDSILAVTLARRISDEFEVPFSVTSLFKFANVRSISEHIAECKSAGQAPVMPPPRSEADRDARERSVRHDEYRDCIAIIGVSCRFPGASDVRELWRNLKTGRESIEILSDGELRQLGVPESLIGNPRFVRARATIPGKELFDAGFWDIAPRDAEMMDPQLRHLLQHSWRAVEDAGYRCGDLSDACVFMSASNSFYRAPAPSGQAMADGPDQYVSWVLAQGGTIPTVISHRLGLEGRSLFLHSNCSSSLLGLEAAHRAITSGESKHALVGAATLFPFTAPGYLHQSGMNFSSDGHLRAFDAAADGMIGGEGVAVIVLKRAIDAIEDGDHIYALVRGVAVNNDGARKSGYYAPSVQGQARVIERALEAANVGPETIGYIEAHGTGTRLGDPIEFAALREVYRKHTAKTGFCGIGSIKTNLGHLDTAAGLAGCIKAALVVAEGEIPPTLHYEKPNGEIELDGSPFYIAGSLRTWDPTLAPRRAAVSSFGIGGTNAHAILEQPPVLPSLPDAGGTWLVPLSARDDERLRMVARNLLAFLQSEGDALRLADVAYTLQVGREAMASRVMFIAGSLAELLRDLEDFVDGRPSPARCFAGTKGGSVRDGLIEEDESTDLARAWLAAGKYAKAARLWASGVDIEWKELARGGECRRVALPTYPFAEQRYWAPAGSVAQPEHGEEDALVVTDADAEAAPLEERITAALLPSMAQLLKRDAGELDVDAEWHALGFDSISLSTLAARLSDAYGFAIEPTIFFEHATARRFVAYLASVHGARIGERSSIPAVRSSRRRSAAPRAAAGPSAPFIANEPIAIIGMSGRFPQSRDLDAFWGNLLAGKDCITEIPKDRWDWEAVYGDPQERNRTNNKWGAFIDGIAEFDPLFFGISPREAELMDPQQRLLMMHVWKAIEDAGYSPQSLSGSRTAIFAGTSGSGYEGLFLDADLPIESYSFSGLIPSLGPARMSYLLNLRGPSEPIETACSSSLVAIHRGLHAIAADQCEMAIVGGVNTIVSAPLHISVSKAGMLADDGRCKSFSAHANGFVRGEGVGMLLLKRLSAAERDGDHIYALIRATAENHGGRASSLTAPNPLAQAELLRSAYTEAGIDPRTVTYIEAHGTGTALGDPIEINALKSAFADLYAATGTTGVTAPHCGLGSVKSNVGHLELAAGIAGVMKVLLQLEHKTLVKSLHCEELNPYIDLEGSPFYVVRESRPWTALRDGEGRELPRRAGVSSFGIGGVNAHVVLEEYVAPASAASEPDLPAIIVLSAKNDERLAEQAAALLRALDRFEECDLPAIACTLQTGRDAMDSRLAMTVSSMAELGSKLQQFLDGVASIDGLYRGSPKRAKDSLAVFAADEDLGRAIEAWVEKRKYARLLELWVNGLTFDWSRLWNGRRPRRVSLPTYPFARDRYWPAPASAESLSEPAGTVAAEAEPRKAEEPFELMTFEETWEESPLSVSSASPLKTVVCFASAARHQQIRDAVRSLDAAAQVVFVEQGEVERKHSPAHYSTPASDGAALLRIMEEIAREHPSIDGLLYLWPLEDRRCVEDPSSIVWLLKALAASRMRCRRLLLAGEAAGGPERCHFESWMGFEKSLRLVLPNTSVAVIFEERIDGADAHSPMDVWLPRLWQELRASKAESALYRGGRRYAARVRASAVSEGAADVLRTGGTYLITGGAGGLGLLFAAHLAATRSANLILTGRSALDAGRRAAIERLETLGGNVLYVQADVCDADAMRAGVERGVQRFGAIHGVIHAAGVAGELSILENELSRFRQVLAPKIGGTLILDEVLAAHPLDFTCYFSSSSAVLGDFGGCDYAIANRFELAFAGYRDRLRGEGRRHGRTLAIAWPHWKDGGMSAGEEHGDAARLYLKSSGQRLLEAEEGLAAFERLLGQGGLRNVVMTGQRSRVHRFLGVDAEPASASVAAAVGESPARKGRRVEMRRFTLEQCVAWDLKEHASALVKIPRDRLDLDENLADFGFDSIGLGEFAKRLSQHYGIDVTPSIFFSHPTLGRLAEHFARENRATLEEHYREEAAEAAPPEPVKPHAATSAPVRTRSARGTTSPRDEDGPEPIAIIGMSGRFPGARNVDEMWRILAEGRNAVTEIPADRFDWRKYYGDPRKDPSKTNSRWSGLVPGVAEFDALFFEISPMEAETMDPRQRLLLQEAWKALEDAGYASARLGRDKTGMFVGVEQGDYQLLVGNRGGLIANHDAVLAARLSYFLNLRGPTMAINTTCSAGLVAAHQACQSLRNGECDTAVAAAVNLMLTPYPLVTMGQAGMLSPDGKCYAFDERANGMVPGEAVVVVVLKRLEGALRDGDTIHAVIRGSGVNYDGKTNGITAPSGASQTSLLREVYDRARIHPRDIDYIVTHGTGTNLGDPVEINALCDAFKPYTSDAGFCALTSTKTNFGHTFAASGLVSLVSLVEAMRHETIPASLHCERENGYIQWQSSPFFVNKSNRPWPKNGKARIGAVSAFGMSGTNAHMVVESYDAPIAEAVAAPPLHLLVLSAKSEWSLEARARDLLAMLQEREWTAGGLHAVSATLLCARQHFDYRYAVVIEDRESAIHALGQFGSREKLPSVFRGRVPRGFVSQQATLRYAESLLRGETASLDERLCALADLYCQGYEPDWEILFGEAMPPRVALPTYPFAEERHWISEPALAVRRAETPAPSTRSLLERVFEGTLSADEAKELLLAAAD